MKRIPGEARTALPERTHELGTVDRPGPGTFPKHKDGHG